MILVAIDSYCRRIEKRNRISGSLVRRSIPMKDSMTVRFLEVMSHERCSFQGVRLLLVQPFRKAKEFGNDIYFLVVHMLKREVGITPYWHEGIWHMTPLALIFV